MKNLTVQPTQTNAGEFKCLQVKSDIYLIFEDTNEKLQYAPLSLNEPELNEIANPYYSVEKKSAQAFIMMREIEGGVKRCANAERKKSSLF